MNRLAITTVSSHQVNDILHKLRQRLGAHRKSATITTYKGLLQVKQYKDTFLYWVEVVLNCPKDSKRTARKA